jgi:hypothetical protein
MCGRRAGPHLHQAGAALPPGPDQTDFPGVVAIVGDSLMGVMDVTVHTGRITEINFLAGSTRLRHLAISA